MKKEDMLIELLSFFLKWKNFKNKTIKVLDFEDMCKKKPIPQSQKSKFLERVVFQIYTSAIVQWEFIPTSKELINWFIERDFEKSNESLIKIVNHVYKTDFTIKYNQKWDEIFLKSGEYIILKLIKG